WQGGARQPGRRPQPALRPNGAPRAWAVYGIRARRQVTAPDAGLKTGQRPLKQLKHPPRYPTPAATSHEQATQATVSDTCGVRHLVTTEAHYGVWHLWSQTPGDDRGSLRCLTPVESDTW